MTLISRRQRVGLSACLVLIFGTALICADVAFLSYFWAVSHNAASGWHEPQSTWYNVVTHNWATKVVTLSSAFLRLAVGLQCGLVTSMLASILVECCGVRLSKLPALSIIRGVRVSPHNLVSPLVQGPLGGRRLIVGSFAIITIIVGVTSQFTSTILLLDFGNANILAPLIRDFLPFSLEFGGVNGDLSNTQGVDYWNSQPPLYARFAEMAGEPYSADGVQDTGLSFRAYVPFGSTAERTMLRSFIGFTQLLDSRVVCVRPQIDNLQIYNNWEYYSEYRSLSGNASMAVSYSNISTFDYLVTEGIEPYFNCTLSMWDSVTPGSNIDWRLSLCLLHDQIAAPNDGNILEDTEFRKSEWSTFMVFNTSGGADWTWPTSGPLSGWAQSENGVWSTWMSQDGMNMLSATMCFSLFAEPSTYQVDITANPVEQEPIAVYDSDTMGFETENITSLYCTHCKSPPAPDDGRMTLRLPSNWTEALVNTTTVTGKLELLELFTTLKKGFYDNENWIWATPTVLITHDVMAINQIHVDVFQDIINETGNVALAIQSLFTILTQRAYYDWLPRFDVYAALQKQHFESYNVPVHWTGFTIVAGILLVHGVNVLLATVLFLSMTDKSFLGSSWPAVAQVFSSAGVEGEILAYASDMSDKQVDKQLVSQGKGRAICRIGYRTNANTEHSQE